MLSEEALRPSWQELETLVFLEASGGVQDFHDSVFKISVNPHSFSLAL